EQDSFTRQQLTLVKSNANRLLKLVNELMDFRKAETGNVKLYLQKHDLVALLQEIYDSFRHLSLEKRITPSFVHDTEQVVFYFDREQLEKVFFNLLTNAFKFTPEGGNIRVQVEQKNKVAVVTVTDNGRGIAPEYLPKLFTNFFQVADHGIQNTGYGIGLALSKNIVELHNGAIAATSGAAGSNQESNTSFTVTLPLLHAQADDIPVQDTSIMAEAPGDTNGEVNAAQNGTPTTILVVEDTREIRTLIKETFRDHYQVLEAENGQKGLELATGQVPDIIISDVMMPEMDGFALCAALKTDERTSHIPVILLTAKSSQADQVSGLETGADIYLTKPFSTKVLALNVRNLLAARERMRQKFSGLMTAEPGLPATDAPADAPPFVNTVDKEFLQRVMQLVEDHMDDPDFSVAVLSVKVAMSRPVLYKKIKAVTGMSVNDFIVSLRLKKAAQLLKQKHLTVYEVAYAVGYNDRKYFSKEFKKQFGKTPSEYAGVSDDD
ncbi:MAG TPA: ATP-binding protein, partial [Chitinophagaceae bacterium]|nr:ATP-binding protein [Chitinophagaceae bacterium]